MHALAQLALQTKNIGPRHNRHKACCPAMSLTSAAPIDHSRPRSCQSHCAGRSIKAGLAVLIFDPQSQEKREIDGRACGRRPPNNDGRCHVGTRPSNRSSNRNSSNSSSQGATREELEQLAQDVYDSLYPLLPPDRQSLPRLETRRRRPTDARVTPISPDAKESRVAG